MPNEDLNSDLSASAFEQLAHELDVAKEALAQKEQELLELSDEFNSLVGINDLGGLYLDKNLCVLKYTHSMNAHFGIDQEDIEKPLSEVARKILRDDLIDLICADARQCLKDLTETECQFKGKNGHHYLKKMNPVLSSINGELKGIMTSFIQIDLVRAHEKELERLTQGFEKAQEIAGVGSWVLDIRTGEVEWSAEQHRMFGQDPAKSVPSLEEQETWYTKKSWAAMNEAIQRSLETGCPYSIELEFIRKDGSMGILLSQGKTENDENGRVVMLRGVAHDITEAKVNESKLKTALKQAKASQVYKDQFLANMSHEIRTPMNGVVAFASLLRDDDLDDVTRNSYIDRIESCSDQLLNLIDDIIDNAKLEAGELKIDKSFFELGKLMLDISGTVEELKSTKAKDAIQFITTIPEDCERLTVHSDALRIQQILMNLLTNSLKFSESGCLEFSCQKMCNAIRFTVKDEGIGIAEDKLEQIFERFEHLDGRERKYEGTGLGLSISKGLSELLGGSLKVESALGVGSTFYFELPLGAVGSEVAGEAPQNEVRPEYGEGESTILVVDDESINLEVLGLILRSKPIKVLFAENGEEAVRVYRENPGIGMVLMDIRMPGMSGDIAAKEILEFDKDAKIVAQTAYAMQEERDRFMKIGFVDHLAKPYKHDDLINMVETWIRA